MSCKPLMNFSFPLSVVVPQQVVLYFKVLFLRQLLLPIGAALNIGNSIWLLLCNRPKRNVDRERTKAKQKSCLNYYLTINENAYAFLVPFVKLVGTPFFQYLAIGIVPEYSYPATYTSEPKT